MTDSPPIGSDPDLNEAIKIILATNGFKVSDPEIVSLVEIAIRNKLEIITANAHFYARKERKDTDDKFLYLSHLKQALTEEKIKIDRPEFIIQQSATKNTRQNPRTK